MTLRNACATMLLTAVIFGGAGQIRAQQTGRGGAETTVTPVPLVSLKVTVTISRFEGEKRTANLPFVLWVNTGPQGSSIRMGSDVPVPSTAAKDGVITTSYTYRSLGTNIDCQATALGDGLFRVGLSVDDSQVFRMSTSPTQVEASRAIFQNFRAQHQPILRDGQTVQFAVATDKTSGEVIKLDVTLNLVK